MKPQLVDAGDRGLMVRWGSQIDPRVGDRVRALDEALAAGRPVGVTDVVPGYASLLVIYEPGVAAPDVVRAWLSGAVDAADGRGGEATAPPAARTVEIPVLYHQEVAPDLETLAREKDLTVEALAALHAAPRYRCHLLGFRPGFPFLGGLDPLLAASRLTTPRLRVPAGSVGIGGRQTGVYPVDSPGGWRIIGRTPLHIFDPGRADPFLVHAGDAVRFVAVDREEYRRLGGGAVA